jgi:5-methylcytosine-specific restriction protein B
MNTADRSIALVDYALRRRFVFLDVRPDRSVILNSNRFAGNLDRNGALWLFDQVADLFQGDRELLDLQVGHSYFLQSAEPEDEQKGCRQLARRFGYEVYPLLLEYEAEGRFEENQLDQLLTPLGCGAGDRPSQVEIAEALTAHLLQDPLES